MSLQDLILILILPLLGVTILLTFVRLVRGPSLPDRVVALDLLSTLGIGVIAAYAIATDQSVFLDVASILALITFLRMPDLFLRMSATTKAATLGVSFFLLSLAVYFGDLGITSRAVATIIFVLLTAPVAAHMIARAAYLSNIPLCEETVVDELSGRYDQGTHMLESHPCSIDESLEAE
jgi:multicomponent Na+:H+ antiporter subunit G